MSTEEIEEYKREKEEHIKNGFARWNWFGIRAKLCSDDPSKSDKIDRMNWIEGLTWIAYWQDRDKEMERIRKEQERNKKR